MKKKTNKLYGRRRRSNFNKRGGMHIAFIMIKIRDALGGNTSIIYQEMSEKGRLGKPRGMINLIVTKLAEEKNDTVIIAKIKKLEDNIKEISSILGNKRTKDETKLNNILKLMEGKLDLVTNNTKKKCPSGRHNMGTCDDADLCESQGSRWDPDR